MESNRATLSEAGEQLAVRRTKAITVTTANIFTHLRARHCLKRMVLRVWSLDQYLWVYLRACWKSTFSGPTSDSQNEKVRAWGPAVCDSDAYASLRNTLSVFPGPRHSFLPTADEEDSVLIVLQIVQLKPREGRLSKITQLGKGRAAIKPRPSGRRRKIFWIIL